VLIACFCPPYRVISRKDKKGEKFAAGVKKSRGKNLDYAKLTPAIPAIIASFFKIIGKPTKST
jgi:hypothetical protein